MARILVVDDEEQIRGLLASFFTRTGFEVTLASGGEEAVRLLKSGILIDLMILDMTMPKVTGADVLKEKKSLKNTSPVLLLTGNTAWNKTNVNPETLGIQLEDVVYKPVDLFILLAMVKNKLGMSL